MLLVASSFAQEDPMADQEAAASGYYGYGGHRGYG